MISRVKIQAKSKEDPDSILHIIEACKIKCKDATPVPLFMISRVELK